MLAMTFLTRSRARGVLLTTVALGRLVFFVGRRAVADDETRAGDQTAATLHLSRRFQLVRNPQRLGKACNASTHLREAARAHDVVAVLDADDFLLDMTVLAQLAHAYRQGNDVVWTNYLTDHGRFCGNGPLDRNKSPRAQHS